MTRYKGEETAVDWPWYSRSRIARVRGSLSRIEQKARAREMRRERPAREKKKKKKTRCKIIYACMSRNMKNEAIDRDPHPGLLGAMRVARGDAYLVIVSFFFRPPSLLAQTVFCPHYERARARASRLSAEATYRRFSSGSIARHPLLPRQRRSERGDTLATKGRRKRDTSFIFELPVLRGEDEHVRGTPGYMYESSSQIICAIIM